MTTSRRRARPAAYDPRMTHADLQDWLGWHPELPDEAEAPMTAPEVARHGDRPLTLGERKSLARQPSRAALARLLRDPHPAVVELLLDNSAIDHGLAA